MPTSALQTLLALRLDGERRAEQALANAMHAFARAMADSEALAARAADARAEAAAAKTAEGAETSVESAADAQARRRFRRRLDDAAVRSDDAVRAHRRDVVTPAEQAVATARAEHLRSRQRREVVEKTIGRRESARRLQQDRRSEAAADDLPLRRR
jgi:flagellar biosynthesis chaperone FliJ